MTHKVDVGTIVWWYPDGDRHQEPFAAVVTALGQSSVCLNIFDPQSYNLKIRDGVRHIDDDACRAIELKESGGWDFTPLHRRLLALTAEAPVRQKATVG